MRDTRHESKRHKGENDKLKYLQAVSHVYLTPLCRDISRISRQLFMSGGGLGTDLHWMAKTTADPGADLLEGDMASVPVKHVAPDGLIADQMDTLDEPIGETLMRDLRGIADKIKHVILPTSKSVAYRSVLKDWDLWVSQQERNEARSTNGLCNDRDLCSRAPFSASA